MTKRRFLLSCALAIGLAFTIAEANAQSGEVVFYGYAGQHVEATVEAFNRRYPDIEVKTITGEGRELLARLIAEKDRPQADVLFGDGDHFLNHSYLFQPYRSEHHDAFPEWALMKVGDDIFAYGYTISIQVFLLNNELMPLDKAPKAWADLVKPEYKRKFMVGNPALTSAGYYSFFQFLQMYGWDAMEQYVENAVFSASVNAVPVSVARGEIPMGLVEETKSWDMAEQGYPVTVYYPNEGIVPTVSGIGLIKNSPNPENGRLFAEFINSLDGHNINVATRNRRTPRIDSNAPKGLVPFSELKLNEVPDEAESLRMREEWLTKFEEIFFRKGKETN